MKLYIDIDDVLAETTRTLAQTAHARFGKKIDFEEMLSFDLRSSLQLDQDEYETFMLEVHEPAFLRKLEPVENAMEILSRWDNAGARIELVTGRPPSSRQATLDWLADHSIPYHSLEFVDKYGRHKDDAVLQLADLDGRNYSVAIEDSLAVATHLAENTQSHVLLFDRPWNRDTNHDERSITRVFHWREISEHLPL
ncbi:MAG: bifunctional metallophosphatase/5'-nucleotidase [Myxococcota bacterium]|nr:bifunctional metallophosphatase/5'-nucleotidase [Myxococcota bacterium]